MKQKLSDILVTTDKQKLLNLVARKLVEQEKKSFNEEFVSCVYTANKNNTVRCAGGWCLTEDALEKVVNSHANTESIINLVEDLFNIKLNNKKDKGLLDFILTLQGIHDASLSRKALRDGFVTLAKNRKLSDNRAKRFLTKKWTEKNKGKW